MRGGAAKGKATGGKAASETPLASLPKEAEPDSNEKRLSAGSILDMLAQLSDQGGESEEHRPSTMQRAAAGLRIDATSGTPAGNDPAPADVSPRPPTDTCPYLRAGAGGGVVGGGGRP